MNETEINIATPRTDEAIYEEDAGYNGGGIVEVVSPEFARSLELENAQLAAQCSELIEELAESRKDGARLDLLLRDVEDLHIQRYARLGASTYIITTREDIDFALSEGFHYR